MYLITVKYFHSLKIFPRNICYLLTGKYSYFMTTDYPWIPIKFMAERSTICGFTP